MILVVGSTGLLGSTVALKLARSGKAVTGLVRDLHSVRASILQQGGMRLVAGDLTRPDTLAAATTGVDTIVCTASAMLSRDSSNTLNAVDNLGVQALIKMAEKNGARQFIFVSYDTAGGSYPLALAKRAAEKCLEASRLDWTVLQPAAFCEIWFSPAVGFNVSAARVRIYGPGDKAIHYISLEDVAKAVVACVDNPTASRRVFRIGATTPESQLDAVRLWERSTGKQFFREQMPLVQIQAARAQNLESNRGLVPRSLRVDSQRNRSGR
jgi:uncharacterized protein YbjT (DUF2867 family)